MNQIQDQIDQCGKDIFDHIKLQNQKIHDLLSSTVGRRVIYRRKDFDHEGYVATISAVDAYGYHVGVECVDYDDYEPTQEVLHRVRLKFDRRATLELWGDLEQHPNVLAVKTRKAKNNRKEGLEQRINWHEQTQDNEYHIGYDIEHLEFIDEGA